MVGPGGIGAKYSQGVAPRVCRLLPSIRQGQDVVLMALLNGCLVGKLGAPAGTYAPVMQSSYVPPLDYFVYLSAPCEHTAVT